MCNSDFIAQAFEYTINQKSPCFYLTVKVNSKETSCNEIMKIPVDLWFPRGFRDQNAGPEPGWLVAT